MCGILGISNQVDKIDIELLKSAGEKQRHRGPDSQGFWVSKCCRTGLYHNRLAIIDTSINGSQPLINEEHKIAVIFNGEIYNYVELRDELRKLGHLFSTNSDTEVLAIAYVQWGETFVSRLIGMFAFAIYNYEKGTIFFARDRAGEKPLFYRKSKQGLIFSSELKSIFPFVRRRKVDIKFLNEYLENGFVAGENCLVEGVNKLPPGNRMSYNVRTGDLTIKPYWEADIQGAERGKFDLESGLVKLERLLEASIERQLRSDVPIGVLLSGGLDSSIITAIASRKTSPLKTFTIGFPGYKKLDESSYAEEISKAFKTEHINLNASPEDFILYLPKLARAYDEPIIDSSMFPTYLVSGLVSNHCKVVLGGDGGDELFAGYKHYSRILALEQYLKIFPRKLLKIMVSALKKFFSPKGWLERYLNIISKDFRKETPRVGIYFSYSNRCKLLGKKGINLGGRSKLSVEEHQSNDLLSRLTLQDFQNFLPEDILVKVDRASMANSLEVRSPLLDKEIIEFALGEVPSEFKANSKGRKILLKELGRKILPKNYDYQRKQGFSIPLNSWLKSGSVRDYFWQNLTMNDSTFKFKAIKQLFDELDNGINNGERLFGLLIFELWRREYEIRI